MTDTHGKLGKRLLDSRAMCYELAKSGISLPLLFTPQFIACDDTFSRIINGESDIAPGQNDARFEDRIWHQNAIYRASMQAYLAWCDTLEAQVNEANLNSAEKDQLHDAVIRLTRSLAPNSNPGNSPVQHAYESRGASLIHDLHRMTNDLFQHALTARSTTKNDLQIGKHVAATPGAVIHRTEMLEIIQYTPASTQAHAIPLLIIPSPVNRFYLCDLQGRNSLVHYLVNQGFQVYTLSWRNPLNSHRHWNLESYTQASIEAIKEVAKLSARGQINLFGFAAGGMLAAIASSILAQSDNEQPINSATFAITSLQTQTSSQVGTTLNEQLIKAAKALTLLHEVTDAKELARNFAWLCPNNLLWNPLVCNYFSGETSPSDDIFQWNSDTLRTTAGLHCDFLSMSSEDPLLENGQFSLCDTPIDLSKITCDTYMLAGSCDHITPWEACYQTCLALGSNREFVLVNRGHTRALVCPIDATDTCYFTHAELTDNADDWLCEAIQNRGSWWPHWAKWLATRSGEQHSPPRQLGDEQHPKQDPAPGRYVFD